MESVIEEVENHVILVIQVVKHIVIMKGNILYYTLNYNLRKTPKISLITLQSISL
jgi:hypothetical protein